jgi:hypothetical protein
LQIKDSKALPYFIKLGNYENSILTQQQSICLNGIANIAEDQQA